MPTMYISYIYIFFSSLCALVTRIVSSEISANFKRKFSWNLFSSFRKLREIC